jgi:hypothetical protein
MFKIEADMSSSAARLPSATGRAATGAIDLQERLT